jgi:hypothetical protein
MLGVVPASMQCGAALTCCVGVDFISAFSPATSVFALRCLPIIQRLQIEELLDGAVGHTIELQLERGGKPLTVQLPVTDLHDVTPSTMLELAGGSVHALSYQQARNNRYASWHCIYMSTVGCGQPDLVQKGKCYRANTQLCCSEALERRIVAGLGAWA